MLRQLTLRRMGERFGKLAHLSRWLLNEYNAADFGECGAEDGKSARNFREKRLSDFIDGVVEEEADPFESREGRETLPF